MSIFKHQSSIALTLEEFEALNTLFKRKPETDFNEYDLCEKAMNFFRDVKKIPKVRGAFLTEDGGLQQTFENTSAAQTFLNNVLGKNGIVEIAPNGRDGKPRFAVTLTKDEWQRIQQEMTQAALQKHIKQQATPNESFQPPNKMSKEEQQICKNMSDTLGEYNYATKYAWLHKDGSFTQTFYDKDSAKEFLKNCNGLGMGIGALVLQARNGMDGTPRWGVTLKKEDFQKLAGMINVDISLKPSSPKFGK